VARLNTFALRVSGGSSVKVDDDTVSDPDVLRATTEPLFSEDDIGFSTGDPMAKSFNPVDLVI
jgi:hypothetical protein